MEIETPESFNSKAQSSIHINYQAQAEVIRKQIGDLEEIRQDLGLSARKMAQLLLVDPSTWSRWTQKGDRVPPHIYRSLHWYLALKEKVPGLTPAYFLQKDTSQIKKELQESIGSRLDQIVLNSAQGAQRIEDQMQELLERLAKEKARIQSLERKIKNLSLLIFVICFASFLVFWFLIG